MRKAAAFLLLLSVPLSLCAYELNKSVHIRFGMPSKNGAIFNKSGFILLHSNKKKVPLWVSYRLEKEDLENPVKLMRDYRPEPKLKKGRRAELSDYKKRGMYDRARMVPLKDMLRDEKLMKQAQYLSNVCPMHNKLNRKRWRELENKVRGFVKNKSTAWVMAGPVFKDTNNDGKKDNFGMLGKNKVWIPTNFFKIIVYQAKDYSFHAIAFMFINREQKKPLSEYVVAIDEIEKHTGFNFLHLLPDQVEKIMETKIPKKEEIDYFLNCDK